MITITENEFLALSAYIKDNFGIYLRIEKQALITGRLNSVLERDGFDNFTDYYHYLISDTTGNAVSGLLNKITTNHTYFMRESNHFMYFKNHVLPYLKTTVEDRDLRIWSAACATGEEPYTLAILLHEFFKDDQWRWDKKLLASDISEQALTKAQQGRYGHDQIKPLPALWKQVYFDQVDDNSYEMKRCIRDEVIYRKFNLMEPKFPFKKKFHVIFCRNVMIYFDQNTKTQLIQKLYDCLCDGGFLFVGHSESINREHTPFKYIMPSVYRK